MNASNSCEATSGLRRPSHAANRMPHGYAAGLQGRCGGIYLESSRFLKENFECCFRRTIYFGLVSRFENGTGDFHMVLFGQDQFEMLMLWMFLIIRPHVHPTEQQNTITAQLRFDLLAGRQSDLLAPSTNRLALKIWVAESGVKPEKSGRRIRETLL